MDATVLEKRKKYINHSENQDLLRFITCGSVDDGKSTLVGRLLYETEGIYDDQLETLKRDSKKYGAEVNHLDFSLLVDGLESEREQGITIDVAYRYFSTARRKFIIADTPGHEQYTRNMITGASTADLAILLIDARKGITTQTRRHTYIVSLLGIKHLILVINKMDLVHYEQKIYEKIKQEYTAFADSLGVRSIYIVPMSALKGDNILKHSEKMAWYHGSTLIQYLEDITIESPTEDHVLRMPIQWVNHSHQDFRGFSGRILSGMITPGQKIIILPSGKETTIKSLISYEGSLQSAQEGESITCVLDEELDVSRGDVFCSTEAPCEIAEQFETTIFWLSDRPMLAHRQYLFKLATSKAIGILSKPKYRIDIDTGKRLAAKELLINELGCCDLSLDRPIAFEPYELNRDLGAFILIDRSNNATVAAGLIHFALRRSLNIYPYELTISRGMRSAIKEQKPIVLWFTGLSGSGKSTIANLIEQKLHAFARHTILLDGDNIRHGLNRDLGFTERDRVENIRRVAEVAKLMMDAGLITLVSFISPFTAEREMACQLIGKEHFIEIYIEAPLEVVETRDTKGLYQKARLGQIKNLTGIDSPYEPPTLPDLKLDTTALTPQQCAEQVIKFLFSKGFLS